MRQKNAFNFEKEVDKVQCKILFEPEYFDEITMKREKTIEEEIINKKTHFFTKDQEKNKVKKETKLATHIETD